KSGVRQFLWNGVALGTSLAFHNAIAAGDSRVDILQAVQRTFRGFHFVGDAPVESRALQISVFIGDQFVGMRSAEADAEYALRQRLVAMGGKQLGSEGDLYVQGENALLIQVPVGPVPGGMALLVHTTFVPPENIVLL